MNAITITIAAPGSRSRRLAVTKPRRRREAVARRGRGDADDHARDEPERGGLQALLARSLVLSGTRGYVDYGLAGHPTPLSRAIRSDLARSARKAGRFYHSGTHCVKRRLFD